MRRYSRLFSYVRHPVSTSVDGGKYWLDLWVCGGLLYYLGLSLFPRAQSKTYKSTPRRHAWALLLTLATIQGRSLEEVDELFAADIWAWQFARYETHGTGHLLAALENEGTLAEKAQMQEIERPKTDHADTA